MSAKVYFTKTITPEKVTKLYEKLETELKGNVAIKVHSGEVGNQNFIRQYWIFRLYLFEICTTIFLV